MLNVESPNNSSRTSFYADDALEILAPPKLTVVANRFSLQKRKPPPKLDLSDEDPFASSPLTEIRPRRRFTAHPSTSTSLPTTPATPFDVISSPSPKRFTLSVSPPTYATELPEFPFQNFNNAAVAAAQLTAQQQQKQHLTSPSATSLATTNTTTELKDEHRMDAYSALCSGASRPLPVPPKTPTTPGKEKKKRRSHYMTRRQTAIQAMQQQQPGPPYTPPLTPDLSGSSSSSGSSSGSSALLLNSSTPSLPIFDGASIREAPPSPSPTSSTFMKKLLSRKSTGSLPRSLTKHLTQASQKELPPLPFPVVSVTSTDPPSLPRVSALMAGSDMTLDINPPTVPPQSTGSRSSTSQRASPTLVNVDAPFSPALSPLEFEGDAGLPPQKQRKRLLSFASKSFLRSKVDLYEANGGRKPYGEPFDEWALPTPEQLHMAGSMLVVSESGVRVRFGDLWKNGKTVVIFIRHFRFAPCQDYIRSISEELDVPALQKAGLQFVVIGLGSHHMIAPYRQLTGTKFAMYTDPTLSIHRVMGMNMKSLDAGSAAEQGHYVKSGVFGGLRRTLKDAVTMKLPVFEKGGDLSQLGGEFILGPNQRCFYAHRMKTTRSHAPILNIVAASGLQPTDLSVKRQKRLSMNSATADEDAWMTRRRRSLLRMHKKRQSRRYGDGPSGKSMDDLVVDIVGGKMRVSVIEEGVEGDDRDETRTLSDLRR